MESATILNLYHNKLGGYVPFYSGTVKSKEGYDSSHWV